MSSERQLHYVLSAVYSSSEVDTPSIKTRMSSIIKGELQRENSDFIVCVYLSVSFLPFVLPMITN